MIVSFDAWLLPHVAFLAFIRTNVSIADDEHMHAHVHSGWKGTFVCEPDKAKALEMYKAWKSGKKFEEHAAHH